MDIPCIVFQRVCVCFSSDPTVHLDDDSIGCVCRKLFKSLIAESHVFAHLMLFVVVVYPLP